MKRRYRAIIDMWIARIGTVFGWFWFVIYGMVTIVSVAELFDAKESLDYAMPLICAGLTAVHFLIIRGSKKTRELVSDFQYYAQLMTKNKSIDALAKRVREPKVEVEKKLREMCRRGYFHGRIDFEHDCMVLTNPGIACAARCPGCGATTAIYKDGDLCRYCGNPLTVGEDQTQTEEQAAEIND